MDIAGTSTAVGNRLIPADALLVSYAEHFDPFLVDWQQSHPSVFRDLIPKGTFAPFNGASQKSYVFRGSLGVQAGLADWSKVEPSQKPVGQAAGVDRCQWNPRTYTWAYDMFQNSGLRTSWRSPIFCVNDLRDMDEAKRQLGLILSAGTDVVDQTREVYAREVYVKTAVEAGRGIVLVEGGGVNYIDDSTLHFAYDPFLVDADGDTYITFPAALLPRLSTLNWSQLDLIKAYLSDQCPDAASSSEGGMPIFPLMLDTIDFEKMVYADSELREDFRYAKPQQLIAGFDMGFKVYRGFALVHDRRQMRYKIASVDANTVTCKRVLPRREKAIASVVGHAPETNPDYLSAELALAIVFLSDSVQILVPQAITNMGSNMVFAPQPGFNGEWSWINIPDIDTNPLSEKGLFFSRFEYHLQPLRYAQEITVILYKRCTASVKTGCPVKVEGADALAASSGIEANAASGDFDGTANSIVLTLSKKLDAELGEAVTIKKAGGQSFTAYIGSAKTAPVYTFVWKEGATDQPTANTDFTAAVTTVTVA